MYNLEVPLARSSKLSISSFPLSLPLYLTVSSPRVWSAPRLLMDLLEYGAEHIKDGIAGNYFIQKAWKFREFMSSKNLLEPL